MADSRRVNGNSGGGARRHLGERIDASSALPGKHHSEKSVPGSVCSGKSGDSAPCLVPWVTPQCRAEREYETGPKRSEGQSLVSLGWSLRVLGKTVALVALVSACTAAVKTRPSPNVSREDRITVPRTVVTPESAASVPELYALASKLFESAAFEQAAKQFERVALLDPNGDLADDALFRAAEAHDEAQALELARGCYAQVATRHPNSPLATRARVREVRILVHLERFERAGQLARGILGSGVGLNPFDRVLLCAASALAHLELNEEVAASTFIEKGRETIEAHRLDAAGRIGKELSALYYALGELRRRRADRIQFEPIPPDYLDALERRCQLILDAQSAYSDTMRAYDAHWSAMAGYRVGELYRHLHQDILRVKAPISADTQEELQLFEAGMRYRFAVLLEKALANVDLTLGMLRRTGARSSYFERLTQARTEIIQAKDREQAALDRLPYSRATLETALQDLARRAEKPNNKKRPANSAPTPQGTNSGRKLEAPPKSR